MKIVCIKTMKRSLLTVTSIFLVACIGVPDDIEPIDNLNLDQYLGTWYEIARLENKFEKGLSNVTAEYSLNSNGSIKVINRGYNDAQGDWQDITGKACFVDQANIAHLKVSFFGPFYSSYIVFELGEEYEYAFITGVDKNFLWLLSRTPDVKQSLIDQFLETAEKKNFNLGEIIMVNQELNM